MDLPTFLGLAFVAMCISWLAIFFIFNLKTIRKLRKCPALKDLMSIYYSFALGRNFPSMSIAFCFSLPRRWMVRIQRSAYDLDDLYSNTTPLDRMLGAMLSWLTILMFAVVFIAIKASEK